MIALLIIAHLFATQKRLHKQANVDNLTQLTNRRWFMESTPTELDDDQVMMIIDLDYFKRTTDRFGHDV